MYAQMVSLQLFGDQLPVLLVIVDPVVAGLLHIEHDCCIAVGQPRNLTPLLVLAEPGFWEGVVEVAARGCKSYRHPPAVGRRGRGGFRG